MLYFVPTPIGNLSDISSHALEILSNADIAICEDTRVSKSLIHLLSQRYSINFKEIKYYSLHTHNIDEFFSKFDITNFENKICVYMSDAGMPCISDPGVDLVKFVIKHEIPYEFLSGANALLLAAGASGLIEKEFTFLAFLPNSGKEREISINNMLNSQYPSIIYESPKRVLALVNSIAKIDGNRKIFLIKEATKKFETKFSGTARNLLEILSSANLNGEWVIIVDKSPNIVSEKITIEDILSLDLAPKTKAKLLSKITGENSKKIYENLIK